ncbi:hypothetical protein [Flavobacterium sp. Root186]|uniref:hypothetical protein n=1 Tax=Flavobacterium sp. Root186 TaxID=1736485 RepID=UPI000FF8B6E1|nr:hypothetical protein [Flavobacterium sp. Root186]
MEKFEIDIKWGSYLFITNAVSTICIVLLMFLTNSYSLIYLYDILIPVFIVQLIYFIIKAISENNKHHLNKGFRKIFVFVRLLAFYFMLISFSDGRTNIWCFSLLLPYRKKDISELVEDHPIEDNDITLKDFIVSLKRKFSRL